MENDVKFEVTAGFFDAINNDRVYSADDMNRPYRKLISNGVLQLQKVNLPIICKFLLQIMG